MDRADSAAPTSSTAASRTTVRANSAPAPARTTLGLYRSTASSHEMTADAPAPSALRMMVPRLPGSRTPAATTTSGAALASSIGIECVVEGDVDERCGRQYGLGCLGRGDVSKDVGFEAPDLAAAGGNRRRQLGCVVTFTHEERLDGHARGQGFGDQHRALEHEPAGFVARSPRAHQPPQLPHPGVA